MLPLDTAMGGGYPKGRIVEVRICFLFPLRASQANSEAAQFIVLLKLLVQ